MKCKYTKKVYILPLSIKILKYKREGGVEVGNKANVLKCGVGLRGLGQIISVYHWIPKLMDISSASTFSDEAAIGYTWSIINPVKF